MTGSHTETIEYGNMPPELFFEPSPKQCLKPDGVTSGKILECSLPNPGTNPGSIEKWNQRKFSRLLGSTQKWIVVLSDLFSIV